MKHNIFSHCEPRRGVAIPRIRFSVIPAKAGISCTHFLVVLMFFFLVFSPVAHATGLRHVERVIDGDTIILDGSERVRLIGIDTPEVHHPKEPVQCYGPEASDYLRERLEGKDVSLKYQEEKQDKYGRTLAFVYLEGDLINMEMVKEGYAFAYTRFPFKYERIFVRLQEKAKKMRLGLWDACAVECTDVCKTNPISPSPLMGEGRGEGATVNDPSSPLGEEGQSEGAI